MADTRSRLDRTADEQGRLDQDDERSCSCWSHACKCMLIGWVQSAGRKLGMVELCPIDAVRVDKRLSCHAFPASS